MGEQLTLKELALELLNRWYCAEMKFMFESSFDIESDEALIEAKYKEYEKQIEEASA